MDLRTRKEIAAGFNAYVDALTNVIGHADRNEPLRDYCARLLATEGRRSVEPMAATTGGLEIGDGLKVLAPNRMALQV